MDMNRQADRLACRIFQVKKLISSIRPCFSDASKVKWPHRDRRRRAIRCGRYELANEVFDKRILAADGSEAGKKSPQGRGKGGLPRSLSLSPPRLPRVGLSTPRSALFPTGAPSRLKRPVFAMSENRRFQTHIKGSPILSDTNSLTSCWNSDTMVML